MATLFIMVGAPASGKTCFANEHATEYNARVFSSDEYRERLFGDASDQSHNSAVFNALYADLVECLKSGCNAILDSTNMTVKGRKQVLDKVAGVDCKKVAIVMATPIDTCTHRDNGRERKVTERVIVKYIRQFQFPMMFEGFDEIKVVQSRDITNRHIFGIFERMCTFDQQNPHHKYNLLEHSVRLAGNYDFGEIEHFAGLLHDVGKLYTKELDDEGVAHYYNHDSVGAYLLATQYKALCVLVSRCIMVEDIVNYVRGIIFFVNWHMRAHNDLLGEKAEKKYRALFGDDLFNRLIKFAEYDKVASGTYKSK